MRSTQLLGAMFALTGLGLAGCVVGEDPQDDTTAAELGYDPTDPTAPPAPLPPHAQYDRFRAFTPNPGACVRIQSTIHNPQSTTLRLHQAALKPETGSPGTVLSLQPLPLIAFSGGSIELIEVQPEGKKRMSGRDWANGLRLQVGQSLKA